MIKTHKKTNKKLLFKRGSSLVATYYVLDKNDNKIQNGYNTKGQPYYKVAVCLNENLI